MGTQAEFHGGSIRLNISADLKLVRNVGGHWAWHVTATSGGLAVQLPDARTLIPGYPVIQVVNEGATAFAIEDFDGSTVIASVALDDVYTFALFDSSTAAGDWEESLFTQGAAPGPPATVFPWTLGGVDAGMNQNAWRYDFIDDTWSEPGGTSTDTHNFSGAFEVGGVGFLMNTGAVNLERWDPNAWSLLTGRDVSGLNANGASHLTDDKGYMFGSSTNVVAVSADQYDVSDDSWTALTDMGEDLQRHAMNRGADADDKILYYGGTNSHAAFFNAVTTMDEYDISGDSHASLTSSLLDRLEVASTVDGDQDFWVYGGSESGTGPQRDGVEQYDVSGDSWTTETLSPQGTHAGGGASRIAVNGLNYTVGGVGGTSNDDATFSHNPANDTYIAQTDHGAVTGNARGLSTGSQLSLTD